ncbi:GntR family transcriptional regulator [Hyphococcus sp.]|uniref:GntR family transcriptional regulator n=1 Tax=Hyphococcus sp. TaxID=2038636 RepID=UPI003CCBEDB8
MAKKQIRSGLSQDAAYDIIMDAIVTQTLAPSQKVSENILTEMFDISRTTARNIMEHLTAQQFLVSVSPRITRVASLTLLDVKQNFAMRKMLQPNIMAMAAPMIDHDEFAALNESISYETPIKGEKTALRILKANKKFNVYVSEKLRYPLLIHWISQLEDTAMRVYWLYINMTGSLPFTWDHQRELVEAIRTDKAEEISDQTLKILTSSEDRVLKALFSHDQLMMQDLRAQA